MVVVDDNQKAAQHGSAAAELGLRGDSDNCRRGGALTNIIDGDITPRLLLTDFHLGDGSDGIAAINAINAEIASPAPAIMISSDNSAYLREKLDELGIPLLTKTGRSARLRAAMQHLLARGSV